jgi:DNA-binding MarR family transcriptional regulator
MAMDSGDSGHSAVCLRLMRLLPRISRGLRRAQSLAAPQAVAQLSPRHVAALGELREGPLTVGSLAERLDLTLSTVSGVLADLDRAGFITRTADTADRRRTIVRITPSRQELVNEWLDGAAQPLARVLEQLAPRERVAFLKAMDLLETELRAQETIDP